MITVDRLISINTYLVENFGGVGAGIRDLNLLESCVNGLDQEVFGIKCYPRIEDKIAFLVFSIIANHIFLDGNKRTGGQVLLILCNENMLNINATDDEVIDLVLSIAKSEIDYKYVANWILEHESTISKPFSNFK